MAAVLLGSSAPAEGLCLGNPAFSDSDFEEVILKLSETPGQFSADNLLSNEPSFQHVIPDIRRKARRGEVYLGVGPDQNFTYLVQVRPELSFIVDVRRENQLLHLYFKELFRRSANRLEYLSRLFGKPLPPDPDVDNSATAPDLAFIFQDIEGDEDFFGRTFDQAWQGLRVRFPKLVLQDDYDLLRRFASTFFELHLGLKYRSHGRLPRPYYPDYRQLMLETDLEGRRRHFLEREESFLFLKRLHEENRILPVVGDFSGPRTLREIGRLLRQRGRVVSLFYLSNVEFYLFRYGTFPAFVGNLRSLPLDSRALLIRSYFNYWKSHPDAVDGYLVTTLLQGTQTFLTLEENRSSRDYWDLVTREFRPDQDEEHRLE